MKGDLKRRLEELTNLEREQRFQDLRQKLGFASPRQLNGADPPYINADELEEYVELKKMLGDVD